MFSVVFICLSVHKGFLSHDASGQAEGSCWKDVDQEGSDRRTDQEGSPPLDPIPPSGEGWVGATTSEFQRLE